MTTVFKPVKPTMTAKEILDFRLSLSLDGKMFAALIGVTPQAVQLWETGQRSCPETTVRLIKMFQKYPETLRKF